VIGEYAIQKIKDGDVVLTYARSSVVEQTLLNAWDKGNGKKFSVVVADSRPLLEGALSLPNAQRVCQGINNPFRQEPSASFNIRKHSVHIPPPPFLTLHPSHPFTRIYWCPLPQLERRSVLAGWDRFSGDDGPAGPSTSVRIKRDVQVLWCNRVR
jgi:hypothetical protein